MTGDPVEEGGQAVRQGFIQAFQTGAMVGNFLQRRGAESRSVEEHLQRMQDAGARELREGQLHWAKLQGYADRQTQGQRLFELDEQAKRDDQTRKQAVHQRQLDGYNDRARWGEALNNAEIEVKSEQIRRGNADLKRRDRESAAEQQRKNETHQLQKDGYADRSKYAKDLYDLDVKYKKLLIDIRRRAAGFSETLSTTSGEDAATHHASVGFAAAHHTADLSEEHRTHAAAYDERFSDDTGTDPQTYLDGDPDTGQPGTTMVPYGTSPDDDLPYIDVETVEVNEIDVATRTRNPEPLLDAVAGLTEELTLGVHAEHLLDDVAGPRPGVVADTGDGIGAAIEDAGLTGEVGVGIEADFGPAPTGRVLGVDVGIQR
ncbi:hypothetical protein [Nocardia pseudovaccinii]|uniref:hypothetical protein n=1 Tax=Nocardia pseudovaccinii TaxID=189540 RepID=UPI0007A3F69D|nr:hypothetical protein [Nocardia pseudovaccinii]